MLFNRFCQSELIGQACFFIFQDAYAEFVSPLFARDSTFMSDMIGQYKDLCDAPAPTWETHSSLMVSALSWFHFLLLVKQAMLTRPGLCSFMRHKCISGLVPSLLSLSYHISLGGKVSSSMTSNVLIEARCH